MSTPLNLSNTELYLLNKIGDLTSTTTGIGNFSTLVEMVKNNREIAGAAASDVYATRLLETDFIALKNKIGDLSAMSRPTLAESLIHDFGEVQRRLIALEEA